ncbi:MAG: hypothetical protein WCT40_02495 [Candidatus Magasanikbacteria bacterium]
MSGENRGFNPGTFREVKAIGGEEAKELSQGVQHYNEKENVVKIFKMGDEHGFDDGVASDNLEEVAKQLPALLDFEIKRLTKANKGHLTAENKADHVKEWTRSFLYDFFKRHLPNLFMGDASEFRLNNYASAEKPRDLQKSIAYIDRLKKACDMANLDLDIEDHLMYSIAAKHALPIGGGAVGREQILGFLKDLSGHYDIKLENNEKLASYLTKLIGDNLKDRLINMIKDRDQNLGDNFYNGWAAMVDYCKQNKLQIDFKSIIERILDDVVVGTSASSELDKVNIIISPLEKLCAVTPSLKGWRVDESIRNIAFANDRDIGLKRETYLNRVGKDKIEDTIRDTIKEIQEILHEQDVNPKFMLIGESGSIKIFPVEHTGSLDNIPVIGQVGEERQDQLNKLFKWIKAHTKASEQTMNKESNYIEIGLGKTNEELKQTIMSAAAYFRGSDGVEGKYYIDCRGFFNEGDRELSTEELFAKNQEFILKILTPNDIKAYR